MNDSAAVPIDVRDSAQQVLAAVHPVCSHDLPTQMQRLMILLDKIEQSEVDRLSNEGHQDLHRLRCVLKSTADLVDFVKDSVQIVGSVPKPRRIDLPELVKELRLRSPTFTNGAPKWSTASNVPSVVSDETMVLQALTEIMKGLAGPIDIVTVNWESRYDGPGAIVKLALRLASPAPNAWTKPRLDLVLGRARLQHLGIAVAPLTASSAETVGVRLRFPPEAS